MIPTSVGIRPVLLVPLGSKIRKLLETFGRFAAMGAFCCRARRAYEPDSDEELLSW